MTAALARGLSFRQVLWRHAWRLSAKPVAAVARPHRRHAAQRVVCRRDRHVVARSRTPDVRRADLSRHLPRGGMRHRRRGASSPSASSHRTSCSRAADPRIAIARRRGRARAGGVVKTIARALLAAWLAAAAFAPWLAPNDPGHPFDARAYAPPTRVHVISRAGRSAPPFFYAQTLENPLERRYSEDRVAADPVALGPWAARSCRRRIRASRCCCSAATRSVAICSAGCCTARGSRSAWRSSRRSGRRCSARRPAPSRALRAASSTRVVARVAEVVLVLPALYVLLALRSALPARTAAGVRPSASPRVDLRAGRLALRRTRRARDRGRRDGAATTWRPPSRSARAAGRVLLRHLLPATTGFPAHAVRAAAARVHPGRGHAVVCRASGSPTISRAGARCSQDAANIGVLPSAPWLLAPAVAIFSVVLAVNVAGATPAAPAD